MEIDTPERPRERLEEIRKQIESVTSKIGQEATDIVFEEYEVAYLRTSATTHRQGEDGDYTVFTALLELHPNIIPLNAQALDSQTVRRAFIDPSDVSPDLKVARITLSVERYAFDESNLEISHLLERHDFETKNAPTSRASTTLAASSLDLINGFDVSDVVVFSASDDAIISPLPDGSGLHQHHNASFWQHASSTLGRVSKILSS